MSSDKRIELAPDFMKAFGIALVVFGHVLRGLFSADIVPEEGVWSSIDRMIYLFHMPLFFYASGLFIEHSVGKYGYKGFIRKNAAALLLPLVIWSYLQYSIQFVAGAVVNSPVGWFYVVTAPFPPRQQFWFLGVLFLISVTVPLLFKFRHRHEVIWALTGVLLLCQAVFWDLTNELMVYNLVVFSFVQVFVHLPFFMLGIVLDTDKMRSFKMPSVVCAAVFAGCLWAYENIHVGEGWVHMIASVLCVLSVYKIALNITDRKTGHEPWIFAAVFIGMNSMIIYLAHVIGAAGFRVIVSKLGIDDIPVHLVGGFMAGFLGPLLLVPIGLKLAERYPGFVRAALPVRYERAKDDRSAAARL